MKKFFTLALAATAVIAANPAFAVMDGEPHPIRVCKKVDGHTVCKNKFIRPTGIK